MNDSLLARLAGSVMNERQAKVYLALLREKNLSAKEIHHITNISHNKIYGLLESLVIEGYCTKRIIDNSIEYEVIDPSISLEKHKDRLQKKVQELNEIEMQLLDLYKTCQSPRNISEFIDIIYGNVHIQKKFLELVNKSRSTIDAISCPPYAINTEKQAEQQRVAFTRFTQEGGVCRTLNEINELTPDFVYPTIYSVLTVYERVEMRIISRSPVKLYIFDNTTMLTINKAFFSADQEDICASIIEQPNTVETFSHMFNYLWEQGETLEHWVKFNQALLSSKLGKSIDIP